MMWNKKRLGDIADSCLGKMLDQDKNRGNYQLYLANVNVRWGSFDLEDLPQMRFLESENDRYGLQYGDIVICEGGEPGRCAIWKNELPNMKFQKALHRVRVHEGVDYQYLYYWFLYVGKNGGLDQYCTGSTIKHIPGDKLNRIIVDIPPFEAQKKFASILSAYDNLIEVNNKRIKVLEQMAENLYKEWFVRFRFPGHETAEFENGIPKGWLASSGLKPKKWHYGPVAELGMFVRGRNITSDEMVDGQIPVVSAGIEPSGYHNESNVRGKNITISASGANAGYMKYNLEDIWAADCSYMVCNEAFWFIYHSLKFIQPVISNLQCGAAQPHVYPKHINKICIIIPEKKYILNFCNIVSPYYDEIGRLIKQNENLKTQRDLLLPRLMSGKLEV